MGGNVITVWVIVGSVTLALADGNTQGQKISTTDGSIQTIGNNVTNSKDDLETRTEYIVNYKSTTQETVRPVTEETNIKYIENYNDTMQETGTADTSIQAANTQENTVQAVTPETTVDITSESSTHAITTQETSAYNVTLKPVTQETVTQDTRTYGTTPELITQETVTQETMSDESVLFIMNLVLASHISCIPNDVGFGNYDGVSKTKNCINGIPKRIGGKQGQIMCVPKTKK